MLRCADGVVKVFVAESERVHAQIVNLTEFGHDLEMELSWKAHQRCDGFGPVDWGTSGNRDLWERFFVSKRQLKVFCQR